MGAATARERHAARTRVQRAPARPQRRISGPAHPVAKPHAVPRPVTGVFERLRALPDHRIIDRLLRGRAWICFVGVALMGIVAMQVSLLKLNSGIGRAVEATATLERQNSQMEASIARLASGERIRAAADKHGLVTPPAGDVHYLRVRSSGDAARAARRMRAPSDAARELMANAGVVPGSLVAPPPATAAPAGTAPATATAPATTAAPPGTTTTNTAAAPAVTPAPTAAPVAPAVAPTATAPSSGGTVAAAPTPPQG
jgi:cell division protein FtsL